MVLEYMTHLFMRYVVPIGEGAIIHIRSNSSGWTRGRSGDKKRGPARIGRPPSRGGLVHAPSACIDTLNLTTTRAIATHGYATGDPAAYSLWSGMIPSITIS